MSFETTEMITCIIHNLLYLCSHVILWITLVLSALKTTRSINKKPQLIQKDTKKFVKAKRYNGPV